MSILVVDNHTFTFHNNLTSALDTEEKLRPVRNEREINDYLCVGDQIEDSRDSGSILLSD